MGYLVLWALLALIPAAIANSKGRTVVGWFFIGMLISPLIAAVIVAILPSPRLDAQRHAELVAVASAATTVTRPTADAITDLERLAALRDAGVVTSEEFDAKKAELLARV